jgi:hypothetical protein
MLVCKALFFPYAALYTKDKKKFVLQTEICGDIDYSVSKGKITFSKERTGFLGAILTKDYFVTLDYNYEEGEIIPVGRDLSKLPHTLFVRDHKGNLQKIYDIEARCLRLAGSGRDNVLYVIMANPDWTLARINLDSIICEK